VPAVGAFVDVVVPYADEAVPEDGAVVDAAVP
jgi:hypothetical protein